MNVAKHRVEARDGDTVEIVWTLASGLVYVQQVTIPPPAAREARRNAAGQVVDRPFVNAAGQKFNLMPETQQAVETLVDQLHARPYRDMTDMTVSLDVVGTTGGKATTETLHAAPADRTPVRPPESGPADRQDQ